MNTLAVSARKISCDLFGSLPLRIIRSGVWVPLSNLLALTLSYALWLSLSLREIASLTIHDDAAYVLIIFVCILVSIVLKVSNFGKVYL